MLSLAILACALAQQPASPRQPAESTPTTPGLAAMTVDHDDTHIAASTLIRVPSDFVLADANNDGVLQIDADNIVVEFAPGAELAGASTTALPDTFTGVGINLNGHKNVTIRNAHVWGYKVGIRCQNCPGLTIDGGDLSNNFHQRLHSTPKAEAGEDWLSAHHNDGGEWLTTYGAALAVKDATKVTIHNLRIRQGQNGIVLDRVTASQIYDNDCSFLSGWGIAMWRSSSNTISRNALDFCIRGYSHNVYNRGQDSCGLLMFEQNSSNVIAENSITHGGDGVFGFAGLEAIGDVPPPPDFDYDRRGNNDNLFIANDLSDAAAHGLEMTFSYGNQIVRNRLADNAICGVWGGYSQGTLIAENTIENNGAMAYGLERGGINIEHGADNLILKNTFKDNACAVHLWWNNNADLLKKPGVAANDRGVTGNIIANNTFDGDQIVLQLRDDSPKRDKVKGTIYASNTVTNAKTELQVAEGIELLRSGDIPNYSIRPYKAAGETHPVGARKELEGRQNIIMTEWGPWDHQGPMWRILDDSGSKHIFEFNNIDPHDVRVTGSGVRSKVTTPKGKPWTLTVDAAGLGVKPYTIDIDHGHGQTEQARGTLLSVRWDLSVFPWEAPPGPNPPPDLDAWRALAKSPAAKHAKTDTLSFPFGSKGPSEMNISPEITAAKFRPDYFGIVASSRIPLPKGKWRIKTVSDDGIRVIVDGKPLIENWTHHGAATDQAEFTLAADKTVPITVEYFEIYGAATLDFQLEAVP